MGIDPMTQRDRMAEALDAILRLFRGEIVTEKTEWYTMEGCRLHLLPYTKPYPEVAVVSAITPSGGRLAGKYDLGMICVAATNPFGFDALRSNWQIASDVAAEHGRTMDPNRLRLVGPMHIAETRAQAYENAQIRLRALSRLRSTTTSRALSCRRARTRSNGLSRTATASAARPTTRSR